MLEHLEMAPPDPILGLTVAFKEDPRPEKINLGVGVFKDAQGRTPIPACVKKAEERLLRQEATKSYLPIDGSPEYATAVQDLLLGAAHPARVARRVVTVQTPGGTGGLRVAGDFLRRALPAAALWVSDPTWANHFQIFNAAGFEVKTYPYYDAAAKGLDFAGMLGALRTIPSGDVVLLHGCCHNPTGIDPTPAQWREIAQTLVARNLFPLVDFAYQGLGHGIEEDGEGFRILCESCPDLLVVSSFSKNFGLYNERVGALTALASTEEAARRVLSHLKVMARVNYSNPPSHGAAIVATVLGDPVLRAEWEAEVAAIRERIHEMRRLFVETLRAKGVKRDFSFISTQNGMFSFAGLDKAQVERLRQEFAIYMVASGRINVAGMTPGNMDRLCDAIAAVL
ncbi:MAG TPA: amino acid aminotransferase [Candidatus Sumerlaeota bacterium]|nr:amino acid aminotransferase [Candidatus Sumerlaeota bacterium]